MVTLVHYLCGPPCKAIRLYVFKLGPSPGETIAYVFKVMCLRMFIIHCESKNWGTTQMSTAADVAK